MKIINEFKEFAFKENLVDVTIALMIGAGITPIAQSLIKDIVMPVAGTIFGKQDFSEKFTIIKDGKKGGPYETLEDAKKDGAVTINHGLFLNTLFSFLVIAITAFAIAKFAKQGREKQQKSLSNYNSIVLR